MPPNNMPPRRGLALQRSVSARLMQADKMPPGELLWVEDERDVWVLAALVQQQNTILKVRRKDTGELLEIDLVSTHYKCTRGTATMSGLRLHQYSSSTALPRASIKYLDVLMVLSHARYCGSRG